MTKLPFLLALAATGALLTGCGGAPADESAAAPAATTASPSATASAGPMPDGPSAVPSAAPSATASAGPTPDPTPDEPEPEVAASVTVTPDPEWGVASTSVGQGDSFTINGSGYQPGQQVFINFGIAQTDGMVMDEQSATADAGGTYSFTISIGSDLAPGTYAVLTFVADHGRGGPDFEASKRFAIIEVAASQEG